MPVLHQRQDGDSINVASCLAHVFGVDEQNVAGREGVEDFDGTSCTCMARKETLSRSSGFASESKTNGSRLRADVSGRNDF